MRHIAPSVAGLETEGDTDTPHHDRAEASERSLPSAAADKFLARLVEQGLLTTDAAVGKSAVPCRAPIPQSAVDVDTALVVPLTLRASEFLAWLRATSTAGLLRKCASLEHIVRRVQRRKERAGNRAFDTALARRLAVVHEHLRPYTLTTPDSCMFDALSLTELLARAGLFADWVFGVRTEPFAAHCWVQYGSLLLNDSIERVRRFTPILLV